MAGAVGSPDTARPSLTKQAGWLLIAKVIGFAFAFAAPFLVVRVLDQREFGLYKQIYLVLTTAARLLPLSFHMNAFYYLPRRPAEGPKIVLNILVVHVAAGLAGMAALLVYPQMLDVWFGTGELVRYAPLMGIALLLQLSGYFLEVVATANQDVGYSTAFIISSQFTRSLAMVAAALTAGTIEALLYATILQGVVQGCVMMWYLQKRFPGFIRAPDWILMLEQLKYAVPFGLAGLAVLMRTDLHQYMVAHWFSPAEYAIYAVGCTAVPLVGLVYESVNSVVIPRISYLQQQGDRRGIMVVMANAIRKLALFFWPAYVFLMVTRYEFITAFYTQRYAASVPLFLINLQVLPFICLLYDAVMRAYPENKRFFMSVRFFGAVAIVPAVYFGIVLFGMQGALAAVILIACLDYLILSFKAFRILHMRRQDLAMLSDVARIAVAAVLGGVITEGVRTVMDTASPFLVLAILGTIFTCLYVSALFLLGVPRSDETDMVRRKFLQIRRALKVA